MAWAATVPVGTPAQRLEWNLYGTAHGTPISIRCYAKLFVRLPLSSLYDDISMIHEHGHAVPRHGAGSLARPFPVEMERAKGKEGKKHRFREMANLLHDYHHAPEHQGAKGHVVLFSFSHFFFPAYEHGARRIRKGYL